MSSFKDLNLLSTLVASLKEQGIKTPTPVQLQAIPVLLEGKSVVAVAQTGSGKTLAYALPMLHRLKEMENAGSAVTRTGAPRGLVLVPGRELGEQVRKVFKSLTHGTRLRVRSTLGGTKKQIARQNVAGQFEILIATPGRLEQLLDSGELALDDVRSLVFDEADQMLDPGFLPTARRILKQCRKSVSVAMVSATLPQAVDQTIKALLPTGVVHLRTRGSETLVDTLITDNRNVINGRRFEVLMSTIEEAPTTSTILFVNTHEQADTVAEWLAGEAVPHVVYRGQMDRRQRRDNLAQFREGQVHVLLTTDLGGRGLDIEHVDRVINVNLPRDVDNYLHRVGRTARAGRTGTVVNLVTQRDQPLMAKLKKRSK